jgi:hypothetical protein
MLETDSQRGCESLAAAPVVVSCIRQPRISKKRIRPRADARCGALARHPQGGDPRRAGRGQRSRHIRYRCPPSLLVSWWLLLLPSRTPFAIETNSLFVFATITLYIKIEAIA